MYTIFMNVIKSYNSFCFSKEMASQLRRHAYLMCLLSATLCMVTFGMHPEPRSNPSDYALTPDGEPCCVNEKVRGCKAPIFSKEDLCMECELKSYPERYVGCLFCRVPTRKVEYLCSRACVLCTLYTIPTLVKKLHMNAGMPLGALKRSIQSKRFESGLNATMRKATAEEGRNCLPVLIASDIKERMSKARASVDLLQEGDRLLPGDIFLYRGAMASEGSIKHFWVRDFKVEAFDIRPMEDEESDKHVAFLFDKYGVFGPEVGTLIDQIPENVCATYQESDGDFVILRKTNS